MKKSSSLVGLVVLIALLPSIYLAIIWPQLPETVALHFGVDMKPDRFGDKAELWLVTLLLGGISIGVYFLLQNLHRIDPRRKEQTGSATFTKLALGIVVFMAALSVVIIESARGSILLPQVIFPLLGLFFAFMGNYMHRIKPNYFAGLRLPWTLSSNENWRRTHLLAGKIWFGGGLLLVLAGLVLQPDVLLPVFFSLLAIMTLVPIVYSYRLFKQQV